MKVIRKTETSRKERVKVFHLEVNIEEIAYIVTTTVPKAQFDMLVKEGRREIEEQAWADLQRRVMGMIEFELFKPDARM